MVRPLFSWAEDVTSRAIQILKERSSIRRIVFGFALLLLVSAYGVVGFLLRGWGLSDAVYMTVTTISTVGYGEVRPIDSLSSRVHVVSLILMGIYSIAFTTAAFVQLLTEGEILAILGQTRMGKQIEETSDHVIITGFGRVGILISEELVKAGVPFVVIEKAAERVAELKRRDHLHVFGDATEEQVLMDAGVERARSIVCVMPSDANNVFVTLTARQISPKIEIIARAEQPSSTKILHQAGAKHVILPAAIGAHRIATLLTRPRALAFAEMVAKHAELGLELVEIPVSIGSPIINQTLAEADVRHRTGAIVVAIKVPPKEVVFPAPTDRPLSAGESLIVIGLRENIDRLHQEYGLAAELPG